MIIWKIKRASPLRNYWSTWEAERRFPAIAITSNDSRPPGWFQNRAKTLQFSVYFEETPEAQVRLSRVQADWPRLFAWAGHEVACRFREGEVDPMDGDVLRPVRKAIRSLYERARREVPGYLPVEVPAEVEHDLDRERWLRLWRSEAFEPSYREGNLHLEFDRERFGSQELYGPVKRLPQRIRAQKSGTTIVVPHPDSFWNWLGVEKDKGLWEKARRFIGVGR